MSYLRQLPFDTLKIDRSFIAEIESPASAAIVRSIITLAEALGYEVIAEGVETERQVIDLRELGCGVAQGHYFARPAPASSLGILPADAPWTTWPSRDDGPGELILPGSVPHPTRR